MRNMTVINSGLETVLPTFEWMECYGGKRCNLYFFGGTSCSFDMGMHFLLAPEGHSLEANQKITFKVS